MSNGVMTRRGNMVWSYASINKLLTNSHYTGYYYYRDKRSGEQIRVLCPAILTADIVQKAYEARDRRRYKTGNGQRVKTSTQKYTYLLSGLLFCGHCGLRYRGNRKVTQTSYYCCASKTEKYRSNRPLSCNAKRNLRLETTDSLVWQTAVDVLSQSHTFKETVKSEVLGNKGNRSHAADNRKKKQEIKRLENEMQTVTRSIIEVETASLLGHRSKDDAKLLLERLEAYRLQIASQHAQAERDLIGVDKQQRWVDWVSEFGKRVDNLRHEEMDVDTRKRFLQGVLEKIVVKSTDSTTHELTFEFCLPYVDDALIHAKDNKKTAKYRVKPGTTTKTIIADLVKKTTPYEEIA